MSGTNLSFAKIVATPTLTSWSQAYNAGSLFIVLSLSSDSEEMQKELPQKGKQILNNLEAEFFGLEEKTFETIKKAITTSLLDLDEEIALSLSLTYCKEDALYGFVIGNGRITLKRSEKIGVILEELNASNREIKSSSGYLETDDLILIQTSQFAESVPAKTILEAMENTLPNDIAETISPSVHGGNEGGASAIILSYKGVSRSLDEEELEKEETAETDAPKTEVSTPFPINQPPDLTKDIPVHASSKIPDKANQELEETIRPSFLDSLRGRLPRLSTHQLPRQKKLLLGITLLLIGLLVVSIFVVQRHSQSNIDHELFVHVYNSAKKDYDEGEGLLSLNKALALDDYKSAKTTLDSASGKFKAGSNDAQQIAELTAKVDARLNELSGSNAPSVTETDSSSSPVLKALLDDSSLLGATEEDDTVYTLSSKSIASDDKDLVKNDETWKNAKALGTFSGNFYVLDPKEGLLKFVPAGDDYATSTYFKGDAPDLTKAVSLAIDSSIYILFSDGTISKYTKGTKDSFALNGLAKPFSSPKSIYTSPENENLYVLDPNNSRIAKLDKSGTFISEYTSDTLKSAKAIAVSEDEKTAYILSNNKIYKLSL
jgi:DNA-binding beta-propeller fold protein YncE